MQTCQQKNEGTNIKSEVKNKKLLLNEKTRLKIQKQLPHHSHDQSNSRIVQQRTESTQHHLPDIKTNETYKINTEKNKEKRMKQKNSIK